MINRDNIPTTPAYESIEIDHRTMVTVNSIQNPVYNNKVIREHYEMQGLNQIHEESARDSDQLKKSRHASNLNIHTDPIIIY